MVCGSAAIYSDFWQESSIKIVVVGLSSRSLNTVHSSYVYAQKTTKLSLTTRRASGPERVNVRLRGLHEDSVRARASPIASCLRRPPAPRRPGSCSRPRSCGPSMSSRPRSRVLAIVEAHLGVPLGKALPPVQSRWSRHSSSSACLALLNGHSSCERTRRPARRSADSRDAASRRASASACNARHAREHKRGQRERARERANTEHTCHHTQHPNPSLSSIYLTTWITKIVKLRRRRRAFAFSLFVGAFFSHPPPKT